MKNITKLDELKKQNAKLKDYGINHTFYWAYQTSLEAQNETIDFSDVIWEKDIEEIIKNCNEFEIKSITISSTFSGLIDTLATFEELGCKVLGLTKIKSRFIDYRTQEPEIKNAFKIQIK